MKCRRLTIIAALLLVAGFDMGGKNYVSLTDTRMGTDSRNEYSQGNTYPGTGRPFGMHLWTPQTEPDRDRWKYQWNTGTICGFNLTHACSPWVGDYASFTLFPQMGEKPVLASAGRGARFSHASETAHPDYYCVTFRNGIKTELSPTDRCCILRFRYPDNGETAILQVDRWTGRDEITQADGRLECRLRHLGLTSYVILEFSRPYIEYREWSEGPDSGAYVTFPSGSTVEVKVGTSYISMEQAELNLGREIGNRGFDSVRRESRKVWNETLGRIDVRGGEADDLRAFYTCLYRSSLNSRMFYELDSDGRPIYRSVHDSTVHSGWMYSDNGYWDTFRSLFPLHNIIYRRQQEKHIRAIMDIHDQLGMLPSWYMPYEMGGMTGNHSISLLADAWVKGIRPVDSGKIFDAYVDEVTRESPQKSSNGRHKEWWSLGYIPYPDHYGSSSMTVEYAYDDWCALTFAPDSSQWAGRFRKSSGFWRSVFDPGVGFIRGRDRNGQWTPDFRPGAWGGPYIEGNAWQHSFGVLHDIPGMMDFYGGRERFCTKLDELMNAPSLIDFGFYGEVWNEMVEMVVADKGQLNMGNQPCQHIPYLYVYGGQPWKTQYHVRDIMTRLYDCAPGGYPGDEDQGATSAWFVMSALGFYSVCPGTTEYAIGSPLFRKATIRLENGRRFRIMAEGNSPDNIYIRSMTLDGHPHCRFFLDHSDIMNGSTLRMTMGDAYEE